MWPRQWSKQKCHGSDPPCELHTLLLAPVFCAQEIAVPMYRCTDIQSNSRTDWMNAGRPLAISCPPTPCLPCVALKLKGCRIFQATRGQPDARVIFTCCMVEWSRLALLPRTASSGLFNGESERGIVLHVSSTGYFCLVSPVQRACAW